MRSIIEGDRRYRDEESFSGAGFTSQEFRDGELVDTDEDFGQDSIEDADDDADAEEEFPGDSIE